MVTVKDIAIRVIDLQKRGRDYALIQRPAYGSWSDKKLAEGEPEAFIAHLDATSMWLSPEEVQSITESDFEELLSDLKESLGG